MICYSQSDLPMR